MLTSMLLIMLIVGTSFQNYPPSLNKWLNNKSKDLKKIISNVITRITIMIQHNCDMSSSNMKTISISSVKYIQTIIYKLLNKTSQYSSIHPGQFGNSCQHSWNWFSSETRNTPLNLSSLHCKQFLKLVWCFTILSFLLLLAHPRLWDNWQVPEVTKIRCGPVVHVLEFVELLSWILHSMKINKSIH